jgi:hypothetical protein
MEELRTCVDLSLTQIQWLRQHLNVSVRQGGIQHARTAVPLDNILAACEEELIRQQQKQL